MVPSIMTAHLQSDMSDVFSPDPRIGQGPFTNTVRTPLAEASLGNYCFIMCMTFSEIVPIHPLKELPKSHYRQGTGDRFRGWGSRDWVQSSGDWVLFSSLDVGRPAWAG